MNSAVAKQIADLLNSENQLVVAYGEKKVMENSARYIYELSESNEILSCIECKKVQWYQYEVCHLTVNPKHRGNGYAKKILKKATEYAESSGGRIVQCTIREDNTESSGLFERSGFHKSSVFFYPNSGNNVCVWQKVISAAT